MHFKNQHALIAPGKANVLGSGRFAGRPGADPWRWTQGKPSAWHRQPTV